MHVCELCKKKPATIHLTDIHDNVKKELHMCEDCASAKGFAIKAAVGIHQPDLTVGGSEPDADQITCDACGISWGEFRAAGRFGCAHDYAAFADLIDSVLRDIHGRGAKHVGKVPGTLEPDIRRQLLECRRMLREAVEKEAYEDAASLRDRIKHLETQ